MDSARAAAMSDPDRNPWFRRRWNDLPTLPTSGRPAPRRHTDEIDSIAHVLRDE